MNAPATDYIIVSFASGEIFTVGPGEILELRAEDTSSDDVHGKLSSDGITTLGNTTNAVTIEGNYTFYANTNFERPTKIEVA
jgi:hypothetical protein